jgi:hypothetical protein
MPADPEPNPYASSGMMAEPSDPLAEASHGTAWTRFTGGFLIAAAVFGILATIRIGSRGEIGLRLPEAEGFDMTTQVWLTLTQAAVYLFAGLQLLTLPGRIFQWKLHPSAESFTRLTSVLSRCFLAALLVGCQLLGETILRLAS